MPTWTSNHGGSAKTKEIRIRSDLMLLEVICLTVKYKGSSLSNIDSFCTICFNDKSLKTFT